jgi:hypothetical protein
MIKGRTLDIALVFRDFSLDSSLLYQSFKCLTWRYMYPVLEFSLISASDADGEMITTILLILNHKFYTATFKENNEDETTMTRKTIFS